MDDPNISAALAEGLPRVDITTDPPPRLETACERCLARWPRPGLCDWCASRMPPQPPDADELRRLARVIPEAFRGVSWARLPGLTREDGRPRVARATIDRTPADLPRIRTELEARRRGALVGPAGAGKTTLAACWAWRHLAIGTDRVRWFSAPELLANAPRESTAAWGGTAVHPHDLAVSAGALVLDDLGAELEGAQPGSGLLAQRIGACSRVIGERYDRQRPTLVTTALEVDDVARLYGDRVARRVFEAATVVRLGQA